MQGTLESMWDRPVLDLPPERVRDDTWSIRDVTPMIAGHSGEG
jgi:hypothetical protein